MYFVGQNKILFKDKLILGPDWKAPLGTFCLINVPVTLFTVFTVDVIFLTTPNDLDLVLLVLTLGLESRNFIALVFPTCRELLFD